MVKQSVNCVRLLKHSNTLVNTNTDYIYTPMTRRWLPRMQKFCSLLLGDQRYQRFLSFFFLCVLKPWSSRQSSPDDEVCSLPQCRRPSPQLLLQVHFLQPASLSDVLVSWAILEDSGVTAIFLLPSLQWVRF